MNLSRTAETTQEVPIDKIDPSPFQARKTFDEQSQRELAQSIKERGLENSILVRPVGDRFELIAGERRWRAVKLLGWKTIRARVEQVDDQEAALQGLVENVQRKDLSPLEQAHAYRRLTQEPFKLKQDQISQMVGKDQGLISKYLSVGDVGGEAGANYELFINLGLTHLLELARLPDPAQQIKLAQQASKKDLSATRLRALVDQKLGLKKPRAKATAADSPTDPLASLWQPLLLKGMTSGQWWTVSYGLQTIPGESGARMPGWQFTVPNNGAAPKADLKNWFKQMMQAMGDTDDEEEAMRKAGITRAPSWPMEKFDPGTEGVDSSSLPSLPKDVADMIARVKARREKL